MKRIDKLKVIDGIEYYFCSKCKNLYTRENFHNDKRTKYKLSSYCKSCVKNIDRELRSISTGKDDMSYIDFRGTTEEQMNEVKQVFQRAGYDITKEIYPQFREKVLLQYGILLD